MRGFLTTLITLIAIAADAQPISGSPKLIVGITIDQLRQDYMDLFSPLYGEKGFRRIWQEGRYYLNADYNYDTPDGASSVASLFTGTVPMIHGIVDKEWMDPLTLLNKNCADDPDFMGNYTAQSSSAVLLQTTTIGDELKIFTKGKSLVYAIAPERETAIMAAGHAADGAFWLNEENGMWCGSTYYGTFPLFVSAFNMQEGTDTRRNSLVWTPQHPDEAYKYLYYTTRPDRFEYRFSDYEENRYRLLKTSPLINSEINRLLQTFFSDSQLGGDDTPDLLSVTYYAGGYDHQSPADIPMETQDTYARLDQSLAELLDMIEKKVGLQNTLIFITSTGYTDPQKQDMQAFRLPEGEFHLERCKALLNMYLMALYGQGQWVEAYSGQQLYLNRKLIEENKLTLQEVQGKSAEFLIQMSGIREVYTSTQLLSSAGVAEVRRLRNAYYRGRSGDLWIDVMPGWTVIDAKNPTKQYTVHSASIPQPLIFIGWSVKPERIETRVGMDCVAPTVSKAIRIRAPNACTSAALF